MTTRSKIEDAFRRLPILEEEDSRLAAMVEEIARLLPVTAQSNPAFALVGHNATKSELEELEKKAAALAKCIASLHAHAIGALADNGFIDRLALQQQANQLAVIASNAALSLDVPEKQGGGRPRALLPTGIARILAFNYQELTGKRPTIIIDDSYGSPASGPFLELVTEVFNALGVDDASPNSMARSAIDHMKATNKDRSHPSMLSAENMEDVHNWLAKLPHNAIDDAIACLARLSAEEMEEVSEKVIISKNG
jgi:hypothetical protein